MVLGILGGTFNPVHNGHIAIALQCLKELSLDKLYFVPSSNPPHKEDDMVLAYHHRLQMVRIALQDYPSLEYSELDYTNGEKSYTKHLIQRFKKHYPSAKLVFIIGADNISELRTWYDYQWILENVAIVAINRKGYIEDKYLDYLNRIIFLDIQPIDISSSMIRDQIAKGKDIASLVPLQVAKYIKDNYLYL